MEHCLYLSLKIVALKKISLDNCPVITIIGWELSVVTKLLKIVLNLWIFLPLDLILGINNIFWTYHCMIGFIFLV